MAYLGTGDTVLVYEVKDSIRIGQFFPWIHSLAEAYDSLLHIHLSPQLLAQANPWLIDTFAQSDYYTQMQQGHFVYDQQQYVVLQPGQRLRIPSPREAQVLEQLLAQVYIDINLPEFALRLYQGDSLLYRFPVRIGQNREKYLPSEGKVVNLQTRTGRGFISNINESPIYINFETGKAYTHTRRDDGKTTLMPLIPSLEPEINGQCYGQLIHATTNPATLGKAYSHGCIGMREGDTWRLYFYVRRGTPIRIRYELQLVNEHGDTLLLPDVYGWAQ
ncbi:MAG: murein L,D-transpeptidase [Bacteroidetes bacterium]|nr:MAG: murein L,D-transpeptidase [Bacteroidota bacterium]